MTATENRLRAASRALAEAVPDAAVPPLRLPAPRRLTRAQLWLAPVAAALALAVVITPMTRKLSSRPLLHSQSSTHHVPTSALAASHHSSPRDGSPVQQQADVLDTRGIIVAVRAQALAQDPQLGMHLRSAPLARPSPQLTTGSPAAGPVCLATWATHRETCPATTMD